MPSPKTGALLGTMRPITKTPLKGILSEPLLQFLLKAIFT